MATIRVKRGTTVPTTSNLSYLGELAFDYSSNELYARGSSEVIKIGGSLEKVFYYEGYASSYQFNYAFNKDFIYKVHVIASTNSGLSDTSVTTINYLSSTSSNYYGSYINVMYNDSYSGMTRSSSKYTTSFIINDAFTNSVAPSYAVTKVIDFEISPTFESSYNYTYQWVAYGTSITTVSDQSNAPLTYTQFVHTVDGSLGGLRISPGLDVGSTDSIAVTVYRIKRK